MAGKLKGRVGGRERELWRKLGVDFNFVIYFLQEKNPAGKNCRASLSIPLACRQQCGARVRLCVPARQSESTV